MVGTQIVAVVGTEARKTYFGSSTGKAVACLDVQVEGWEGSGQHAIIWF